MVTNVDLFSESSTIRLAPWLEQNAIDSYKPEVVPEKDFRQLPPYGSQPVEHVPSGQIK